MISKETAPEAWATLMYELEDAQEHLTSLISKMNSDTEYDEVNLRIDLVHVFSHLNRAWNRRDASGDTNEENWQRDSQFPTDLKPT
ncbi:hypothetical protein ASF61_07175 [Duganella sp. Leaf126]|uniref:hypothetical protein n=1 Tax=Duganella sp. Leaf126 TaxID=1736266 RepID=UPI000714194A|nr:hypothetical protein [Duganella sp. Leaf126]KQQ35991.1 hypothetical protein ASF61_07175 [Duganella sp. Leaf126]